MITIASNSDADLHSIHARVTALRVSTNDSTEEGHEAPSSLSLTRPMQTNPSNRNQTLHCESTYRGLPVYIDKGPLVHEYLDALHLVMCQALAANRRVLAIRLDLHFPEWIDAGDDAISNEYISRFIASMKAKVKHDRLCARQVNRYAHDTDVRYVWTREIGHTGRVHYHVAMLLSREAYFTLGKLESENSNLLNRGIEAWASALRLPVEQAKRLVHIPVNAVYRFERDTPDVMADFFYRASYLCKASTKQFGNGSHGFGASRH